MIKLSNLIDENCINLELGATRKKDAIEELLAVLEKAGKTGSIDTDGVLKDIMEREKSSSTGIGDGVAIPHKMVEGFDRTVMAFGRKKQGINFDSIDGKPATLFFLILGQEGGSSKHLRILSKLARLMHDPEFRKTLQNASSASEIVGAFKKQEDE